MSRRPYTPPVRRRAKRCRKCRAPIRFLEMASGKWLPVDARPSELRGNIQVVQGGRGVRLDRSTARLRRDDGFDLYVSHWESCPGGLAARVDRSNEGRDRSREQAVRTARASFAVQRAKRDRAGQEQLF